MAQIETPFLIFLALLLASASLGYAVRHQKQNSETSVFSLPLYRRDFVINDTQNLNYIQSSDSPLNFKGGEYVVGIGVGNPVKEFSLVIDTGSDVTWFKCSDQFFNRAKSSSYQPLSCNSNECRALQNQSRCSRGTCSYTSNYVDDSSSTGEFATETLLLGSSHSVNAVAMGCGRTNKGFKDYPGILGLSRSPIAFPSQINAKSFSYCLVEDLKSSSTLEFNSAPPGDSVIVPMRKNPKGDGYYYYVELTGITVGEDHIPIPPSVYKINDDGNGGIIVDSGSTLTALDQDVYVSVRDAFRKNIKNLAASKHKGYETCYDIPSGASASSIDGPQMSFQFSNNKSTPPLGPANYLYRVRDYSTFCLAFKPRTENSIASIIGNVQQTGMRITYDLDKELIGFSANKC